MNKSLRQRLFQIGHLFPVRFRRAILSRYVAYRSKSAPNRRFLVQNILPALAQKGGNILWVGCRSYTKEYPAILERHGAHCTTVEIDPAAAHWGNSSRHIVGDIRYIDSITKEKFDIILCNGIFGFGVDSQADQLMALKAMAAVMRPGALLLLSWEPGRTGDPVAAGLTQEWFEPYALPGFRARYMHRYGNAINYYDFLHKI